MRVRPAAQNASVCHPDRRVEWPPLAPRLELLAAAEDARIRLHVRPTRGSAVVFWTYDLQGLCPYSWHGGAKVAPGGSPKYIAQKFKELPAAYRSDKPLRLPAELAPEGMAQAAPMADATGQGHRVSTVV